MSVSLKGCKFEHTELSIHFKSFNDECAIVKEPKYANLLSQESKLTHFISAELVSFKIDQPCLKMDTFSLL